MPVGIDPGWERNPGKLRLEHAARFMADKVEEAAPELARTIARDMRRSWAVTRLMDEAAPIAAAYKAEVAAARAAGRPEPRLPQGQSRFIPVGMLPDRAVRALRAERRGVIFSGDTAVKQADKHPELTQADYDWLETLLERGEMRRTAANGVMFVERGTKTPWLAVVKALPNGENFLQTLYRVASNRYYQRHVLPKPEISGE